QKAIDDPFSHRLVAIGYVDQIRAAVRRDDHLRLVAITADKPVAVLAVLAFANGAVAVVRIDQRQIERMRQIERYESERQMTRQRVGEFRFDRGAGLALLRNRGKAVIRGGDDIGIIEKSELIDGRTDTSEIIVGIADRSERGRTVDPRVENVEAVALIVLCA